MTPVRFIKNIFGKIFNRLTILAILILFQFAWIAVLILRFGTYSPYFMLFFNMIALIAALFVVYRDETSAYKMGWVMLICLLPILGSTMYVFFGNKRPSQRIKKKIEPVREKHRMDLLQECELLEIQSSRLQHTIDYIAKCGPYPAWTGTKTKYYDLGDKAFIDMLDDLKNAKHYIFMEYFIIDTGYMWDRIFDILQQKIAEGVEVRLIYDDIGSIEKVPLNFATKLEKAGIKVYVFNPLRPIMSFVYNNRDHRKMMVIDGYIAYSGGFNIADEYINKVEYFGHWKDTGIRLEGKAVWNFTVMFLNMWNSFVPTEEDYSSFRPQVHHSQVFDSDGIVQPFSDTPLDNENLGENIYLEILNQAEDYVYIYTPYLILDNEMLSAMQLAAKRGVDVRLITPGIPDKKLVFRLTRSYYLPLIRAGVKIYEYKAGFIHAKSFLADDKLAVVGTINLDYRSLYLHFECGTLMVGCSAIRGLKEDYMRTLDRSALIDEDDCKTGFFGLLIDGVLRAMSPLM